MFQGSRTHNPNVIISRQLIYRILQNYVKSHRNKGEINNTGPSISVAGNVESSAKLLAW